MLVRKHAKARFLRVGDRKLRQVARTLNGLPAEVALDKLNFLPKRKLALILAKTLKSAVANAVESDLGGLRLRPEDLSISMITVDRALIAKRHEFRAQGRVNRIEKRFSHLTIEVSGEAHEPMRAQRKRSKAKSAIDTDAGESAGEEKKPKAKSAAKKAGAKKKTAASKTAAKKTAKSPAKKKSSAKE